MNNKESVRRYRIGSPYSTDAIVQDVPISEGMSEEFGLIKEGGLWHLKRDMVPSTKIYGLGESTRGINKRGWEYISNNTDDWNHSEDHRSLYASHNFFVVQEEGRCFGVFIDTPSIIKFDFGYTDSRKMDISSQNGFDLYIIETANPREISRRFRKLIGPSYIPPRYAFGYGQSRWGYDTKEKIREVANSLQGSNFPVDMIYLDIDYMDGFRDFTLQKGEFDQDFPDFVKEMKERGIHLIPIIDAGIKKDENFDVYREGEQKRYFCTKEDGSTFVGAVWPGLAVFPDVFRPEVRAWFGDQYHILTDAGIDGFWNDMNEPALFYSKDQMQDLQNYLAQYAKYPVDSLPNFELEGKVGAIKNSPNDYQSFGHQIDGRWVSHFDVHNEYGSMLTKAAAEGMEKLRPGQRILLFSRASSIGAHRFSGIWTGDNSSWWSHLDLIMHQLPGINMAGFLFTGCDLGGFGKDTTRELLVRFMQLGTWTPLMRNHSSSGTRRQEPYAFEDNQDLAALVQHRYRLVPYLYSTFLKAAKEDDMMFRPLAFDYPQDPIACELEDQLMVGDEVMIAPVDKQNATGRIVYLPERMIRISLKPDGTIESEKWDKGWRWNNHALNETVFFIREGKAIPLGKPAGNTDEIDVENLELIEDAKAGYELWWDDGISSHAQIKKRAL